MVRAMRGQLGLLVLAGASDSVQGYAFCGGFDLGDHGQGAQCLSDDDGPNGCYNTYGAANSCWSPAPMSSCCNHGTCRGDYDPYTQHCTCDDGWTGARCDSPSSPPPPPPPPASGVHGQDADGYGSGDSGSGSPAPPPHAFVAVDCVGGWGSCSHACTRSYEIHTRPSNGGRACTLAEGTVDTTGCKPGDGLCPGGPAPVPPPPPPGTPSPAGDHVVGVICGSALEEKACFQQFLGADVQDAGDQANQELVVPFSGIAGLTYTFQFREIQSDAFLQMSEKLETHFFDVDSDSITDQPLFLNARVAPTGSLAAVPVGLNTSLDGFHGYVDSRQGGWFNWVCPGTGSWSLLLDGQCQPGQTSCMLGFEVHISGSDRSEEDGALECTGPVGQPGRVCTGPLVTVAVPLINSEEQIAQFSSLFSVQDAPTTVFVRDLTAVDTGRRLQRGSPAALAEGDRVTVHVETRAPNPNAVQDLTSCLLTAATASDARACRAGEAGGRGGRRLQSSNCAAFCGAGRPCTPPCQAWGCSNCNAGGGGSSSSSHSSGGGSGETWPSGDNSCRLSYNRVCDEPDRCAPGTDTADCGNSAPTTAGHGASAGHGTCVDSSEEVMYCDEPIGCQSSKTYGRSYCSTLSSGWAQQECTPTSRYTFFENCPVGCNSMCAVPEAYIVHITPSAMQSFVPGYLHGVLSWFTFDGEAGVTYVIESHNEGTLHLYDASLMSTANYQPKHAMLAGMENSYLVAGSTPYQKTEWTCATTGTYAVLVSQSLWDCNNGCGTVDLSVTRTTTEEANVQIMPIVPNSEMMLGAACVYDMLVTCHYRQLQGSQDLGWANGDGGRQFVLSLDGHAGQTFHFRIESMTDVAIDEMIHQTWWETDARTKGTQLRPGEAKPQMRLGGPTDSIQASFTLYPPAAVGGARGTQWENHKLVVGGEGAASDTFAWICPSAGTWLIVVEATCPLNLQHHSRQECSSGFKLTTTSADESMNSLTCAGPQGAEVCSGPTVALTLEVDAQSEAMLQRLQADVPDLQEVATNTGTKTVTTEGEPQANSMFHLQQATAAQMFEIAQPPALVFIRDFAPAPAPSGSGAVAQYVDATVEIRAANADLSQSISDCLRTPGLISAPATDGAGAAIVDTMLAPVRACTLLNPIVQSNQVDLSYSNQEDSSPCTNAFQLTDWVSQVTAACCGGPKEPLCKHGRPSACSGDCSSTLQGFQASCTDVLRATSNVGVEQLINAASAVCAGGAGGH